MTDSDDEGNFGDFIKEPKIAAVQPTQQPAQPTQQPTDMELVDEQPAQPTQQPTDMELVDEQTAQPAQNENDEVIELLLDNLGTFMDDKDIDTEDFEENEHTNDFIKYVNTGYDDMKNMYDYIAERISREDENDISPPIAITDIGSVAPVTDTGLEESQLTFVLSPGSTAPTPGTFGTASNENLLESLIEEWMREQPLPKYSSASVASGTSHTIGTATQSAATHLQNGIPSVTILREVGKQGFLPEAPAQASSSAPAPAPAPAQASSSSSSAAAAQAMPAPAPAVITPEFDNMSGMSKNHGKVFMEALKKKDSTGFNKMLESIAYSSFRREFSFNVRSWQEPAGCEAQMRNIWGRSVTTTAKTTCNNNRCYLCGGPIVPSSRGGQPEMEHKLPCGSFYSQFQFVKTQFPVEYAKWNEFVNYPTREAYFDFLGFYNRVNSTNAAQQKTSMTYNAHSVPGKQAAISIRRMKVFNDGWEQIKELFSANYEVPYQGNEAFYGMIAGNLAEFAYSHHVCNQIKRNHKLEIDDVREKYYATLIYCVADSTEFRMPNKNDLGANYLQPARLSPEIGTAEMEAIREGLGMDGNNGNAATRLNVRSDDVKLQMTTINSYAYQYAQGLGLTFKRSCLSAIMAIVRDQTISPAAPTSGRITKKKEKEIITWAKGVERSLKPVGQLYKSIIKCRDMYNNGEQLALITSVRQKRKRLNALKAALEFFVHTISENFALIQEISLVCSDLRKIEYEKKAKDNVIIQFGNQGENLRAHMEGVYDNLKTSYNELSTLDAGDSEDIKHLRDEILSTDEITLVMNEGDESAEAFINNVHTAATMCGQEPQAVSPDRTLGSRQSRGDSSLGKRRVNDPGSAVKAAERGSRRARQAPIDEAGEEDEMPSSGKMPSSGQRLWGGGKKSKRRYRKKRTTRAKRSSSKKSNSKSKSKKRKTKKRLRKRKYTRRNRK